MREGAATDALGRPEGAAATCVYGVTGGCRVIWTRSEGGSLTRPRAASQAISLPHHTAAFEVAHIDYRPEEADFVGPGFHFAVQFSGAEAAEDIADCRALGDAEGDEVVSAEDGVDVAGGGEVVEEAGAGSASGGGGEGPEGGDWEGGEKVGDGAAGEGVAIELGCKLLDLWHGLDGGALGVG